MRNTFLHICAHLKRIGAMNYHMVNHKLIVDEAFSNMFKPHRAPIINNKPSKAFKHETDN